MADRERRFNSEETLRHGVLSWAREFGQLHAQHVRSLEIAKIFLLAEPSNEHGISVDSAANGPGVNISYFLDTEQILEAPKRGQEIINDLGIRPIDPVKLDLVLKTVGDDVADFELFIGNGKIGEEEAFVVLRWAGQAEMYKGEKLVEDETGKAYQSLNGFNPKKVEMIKDILGWYRTLLVAKGALTPQRISPSA